jgi:hypothetical protein
LLATNAPVVAFTKLNCGSTKVPTTPNAAKVGPIALIKTLFCTEPANVNVADDPPDGIPINALRLTSRPTLLEEFTVNVCATAGAAL